MPMAAPFSPRGSAIRWTLSVLLTAALSVASSATLHAQEAPSPQASVDDLRRELADLKAEYERRIADLERRLAEIAPLSSETPPETIADAAPEVPVEAPPAVAEAPTTSSGAPAAPTSNYFNPAISLIGNFLAVGGQSGPHGQGAPDGDPSASLRESELGLQAIIDPYAKADVFLSFGEEG